MTPNEVTAILRKFARACRADEYLWGTSLPGVPTEVGAAVESAIEMIERLEATEEDRSRFLVEMGRLCAQCDALRAKIEAMERQEPIKYERRIKRRNEHTWGHWRECYKTDYTKAKTTGGHYPRYSDDLFDYEMRPIYALPGAKGE